MTTVAVAVVFSLVALMFARRWRTGVRRRRAYAAFAARRLTAPRAASPSPP